jgi:hypothetical protein
MKRLFRIEDAIKENLSLSSIIDRQQLRKSSGFSNKIQFPQKKRVSELLSSIHNGSTSKLEAIFPSVRKSLNAQTIKNSIVHEDSSLVRLTKLACLNRHTVLSTRQTLDRFIKGPADRGVKVYNPRNSSINSNRPSLLSSINCIRDDNNERPVLELSEIDSRQDDSRAGPGLSLCLPSIKVADETIPTKYSHNKNSSFNESQNLNHSQNLDISRDSSVILESKRNKLGVLIKSQNNNCGEGGRISGNRKMPSFSKNSTIFGRSYTIGKPKTDLKSSIRFKSKTLVSNIKTQKTVTIAEKPNLFQKLKKPLKDSCLKAKCCGVF